MTTTAETFDARTASAAEVEARLKAIVRETRARHDTLKTQAIVAIGDARSMSAAEWSAAQKRIR